MVWGGGESTSTHQTTSSFDRGSLFLFSPPRSVEQVVEKKKQLAGKLFGRFAVARSSLFDVEYGVQPKFAVLTY